MSLDDWVRMLETTDEDEPTSEPTGTSEPVEALADALAPRLAEELARRIPSRVFEEASTPAHLLTLDELVAELPPAKPPQTWKRWLYERTRRGEIPGCVKLGGMLFFERETVLAWIRAGAVAT
jgi:hypothetical protein